MREKDDMAVPAKKADVTGAALTPMEMLNQAVASGAGIEVLEKLMALQERWEKNQGRKAFDDAMANAKAEMPVILKEREMNAGAGRTSYRYEDMAAIARVVDPVLSKHGLSYRFRTVSTPDNRVTVTCIISHRDGHSEENSLSAANDTSGSKNPIQALGSAVTYLQRYSLKAALGLAASVDDDARAVSNGGTINEQQQDALTTLAMDVGGKRAAALIKGMLKYLGGYQALSELPVSKFENAKAALEGKRGTI